ncbi:MAG TPA: MMPL family transporter [Candidatus Thermoplasmatota archaeon]|nr:MMPL family transporter [Candidatus Thermoplasmatota archaeon]
MGNMPSKWIGRLAAVVLAALAAWGAYLGAAWLAQRWAYGFTFDWYVHDGAPRFAVADALKVGGAAAGLGALAAVALLAPLAAFATRFAMKRLRYAPPRLAEPTSLDVHGARLALAALLAGGLVALALYAYFSYPVEWAGGPAIGPPYSGLRPSGLVDVAALSGAIGAFAGAYLAASTTYAGLVDGRLGAGRMNLIARVSLLGVRHAWTTVAVVLAVTVVAATHAATITTNVDVADVLPRGDPNTDAAHNLTAKFKSSFTQQVTFQFRVLDQDDPAQKALYDAEARKLPDRRTDARPENMSDELYVRAVDEAIAFVLSRPDHPFRASTGAADIFRLVNWTIAGGQSGTNRAGEAAFALPDTTPDGEALYAAVETGVLNVSTLYNAVDALMSPSWRQTAVLVTVDPDADVAARDIGNAGLSVRDLWLEEVRAGRTQYKVFGDENPPQFSVDLPIANAHASELTSRDFRVLLPIIALFIAITLLIAFRSATSVVATFSMLAVAVVWTFGVMGAMDIPLNTLNLAVVPLIMGVGIDYGIHMMNEYQELRARGKTPEEAWIAAGGGSAFALFIGFLTTAAGLLVMVVSPSLLVAQLGLLANVALLACYLLAILFIPAVVTVLGERGRTRRRQQFTPSRFMPAFATGISRGRWAVAAALVLVTVAAVASGSTIRREAFGDPPRNWLPDDPLRQEHERAINGFYDTTTDDVKANVLVFEGDILDPRAHDYIKAVTATLRRNAAQGTYVDLLHGNETKPSRVIGDTLKDLPFIVNTYLTVKDGVPGAGRYLGVEGLRPLFERANLDGGEATQNYPATRAETKATLDTLFASPLRQFGNIFVNHGAYDTAVTVFSVRAATYPDAEEVWNEIQSALKENEGIKPDHLHASFFGNTAINYLFVAKQVPWLTYMSVATNILVVGLVFLFTRSVRATIVVGAMNFLTSAIWIGVLPLIDVGLAINLTLPLVFIFCMGSDYGLHLAMRCERTRDTRHTFEGVGKGVLYSFVTTFGAFLVFTRISDLAGQRAMIATALAIGIVFVTTLLVVPIVYPVRRGKGGPGGRDAPLVERRRAAEPQAITVPVRAPDAPERRAEGGP